MNGLQIDMDTSSKETVTLRLEGTFDRQTAEVLRQSLQKLGPSQDVVVDFSKVRRFVDLAVAVLTRDLTVRVKLRGLAGHQERVFRYFGLTETPAQKAYYVPEEIRPN